jgi:hypothetical protein
MNEFSTGTWAGRRHLFRATECHRAALKYWESDVPVADLSRLLNIWRRKLHEFVGPGLVRDVPCFLCGFPILLASREEAMAFRPDSATKMPVCTLCGGWHGHIDLNDDYRRPVLPLETVERYCDHWIARDPVRRARRYEGWFEGRLRRQTELLEDEEDERAAEAFIRQRREAREKRRV